MKRAWVVDVVKHLPQGLVSRGWGWLARRRQPKPLVQALQRTFVRLTGIDMAEAAAPLGSYVTLEDLFVRRLRPGLRRVDAAPDAVVSPVDGVVGACGVVQDDTLLQVKGRSYRLSDLLDDPEEARRYEGGAYATLYLSPRHYHRIHAPVSGEVKEATLIPGALMPVFVEALQRVDGLFARNERLVTYIDSVDAGRVAVVKVGATLVGRISVAYDPEVATNIAGQTRRHMRYDPPKLLNKGGELGAFELGSTVILIGEPGRLALDDLVEGGDVLVGKRIGALLARQRRARRRTGEDSQS